VEIAGHPAGGDAVERAEIRQGPLVDAPRLVGVQIPDVLRDEDLAVAGEGEGRVEVPARREKGRKRPRGQDRERRSWGFGFGRSRNWSTESSACRRIGRSWRRNPSHRGPRERSASAFSNWIGSSVMLPEVAMTGKPRSARSSRWSGV
jgi:hypothetical protein